MNTNHPCAGEKHSSNVTASVALHELRGPLQSVQAFLSVVLSGQTGNLNSVQQDFLASALSASRRLERLIKDIHVMLSLDTGFSVEYQRIDLRDVLEGCCRELSLSAVGHHVDIVVDVTDDDQWIVVADPIRIEQVVLNILENAIYYSRPHTTIRLQLQRSRSRVLCLIENEALESSIDNPASWFTPFVRAPGAQDIRPDGWGVGLVIANHLIHAHSGRMYARARNGTVTIGFTLPSQGPQSSIAYAQDDLVDEAAVPDTDGGVSPISPPSRTTASSVPLRCRQRRLPVQSV